MKIYLSIIVSILSLFLASCQEDFPAAKRSSGFDSFVKNYNLYIKEWLAQKIAKLDEQAKEEEKKLANAANEKERQLIQSNLQDIAKKREKYVFRQSLGDFIAYKKLEDLPSDLKWETGMNEPEIGDPRAKKGGTLHTFIPGFPPTLSPIGPNSNNSFRGEIYDNIDMGLVSLHPITQKFIPSLANEWAVSADQRTVYYKIDPDATFSDGKKVTTRDFLFGLYIRLSDDISAPFQKQYYREQLANVTVYSDRVLSVTLPTPKPLLPFFAAIPVAPAHFYDEYGPDYAERYQWRIPPTTGAYTIKKEDIKKGRSITLTRVKNWWAKDKKYTKYSNNVDKISYLVIAEMSKAFELFRLGKIDYFPLGTPAMWYDRMEIREYFDGYIEKAQFYNIYPRVPRGMYLNVIKSPLQNLDVRIGLAYSFNFKKVNTILYRGDAERLEQFSEGYGEFTNPNIRARRYSIIKAREHFAKAGYTKSDREGYLVNDAGKRLQVEVSWSAYPLVDRMMATLKEEAQKAGVEILFDAQPSAVNFSKVIQKRHQIAYSGWGVSPPFPRYYQFFHSKNAFDEKGNVKQQTNNINSYANPRMDKLCEIVREAKTTEELRKAAWEVQQIVHDEAIFIPALKTAYTRSGYWRWLKFPQTKLYQMSTPQVYSPIENYLYWIDEDVKNETLKAKKQGKVFPEQNHLYDLYKNGIPPLEKLLQRTPNKL